MYFELFRKSKHKFDTDRYYEAVVSVGRCNLKWAGPKIMNQVAKNLSL